MAKNISLLGADYPDVPAVTLPQTGGGTATFYDVEVTDGDPTLAWGTRSKVGTINDTDLHVTMPEYPKCDYYALIENGSYVPKTNYTTWGTYNSRKFSDYKILVIFIVKNNWVFPTAVIPRWTFTGVTGVALFPEGDIEVDIKYKSDTEIECKYTSASNQSIYLRIYGLV